MRKTSLAPWLILFFVLNLLAAWFLAHTADLMRVHWSQILPGESLSVLTQVALRMPNFFYFFTVTSLAALFGIWTPRVTFAALIHFSWCNALCELVALAVFVYGVTDPGGRIFYGLGP